MPTDYPGGVDAFTNPQATDPQSSPSHSAQHRNANDAIEAIEAELGTNPAGVYDTVVERLDALGAPPASTLDGLTDVDTTGQASGDGLVYNGSLWVPVDVATQAELDAHVTDTSAAHAASAISADSTTLVGVGTDVQAVLEELDNGVADHLADTSAAHAASAVSFSPTGTVSATDVQAAIAEVASEASGGTVLVATCNGRLTLTTGTPVTTADVTAAGTLYFTPYHGNQVALYSGTVWALYTLTERSLALTLTSGKNYDVFLYDNTGTLTLELSAAWTNDTTRADALALQDGVYVKSGATTRRWLGTIRASGTNTTEDSGGGVTTQTGGKRFVWNAYNRVRRHVHVHDTTNTWVYTSTTIRQANGAAGNKVEYVCGADEDAVEAEVKAVCYTISAAGGVMAGVGVDATNAFSGIRQAAFNGNASGIDAPVTGRYLGYPGLGYHYLAWCEAGNTGGTAMGTWSGDNGDTRQCGLIGSVYA